MLSAEGRPKAGLCISLFNATSDKDVPESLTELEKGGEAGHGARARCAVETRIRCCFLAAPHRGDSRGECGANEQVFVVTAAGTVLSFVAGSVGQWRRERWC